MTERREDPRIPLTSGSIIKISHKLNELETETISYYVEECIASGGQALLYKCKNSVGHPYCIKEYYPFDAIRNEESDDKEIIPFCGWDDIRNGLQISQKLARSFAPTSHQAFFLPIDADDERMVEVMPYATNDCCTLGECVARWDSECNVSSETRIKKAVQIIDSFLTVLVKLHEFTGENNEFQGLVHRDINPDNILWAENDDQTGVAFPIDFSCCSEKDGNNSDCKSFSPGYSHPYLTDVSIQVDLYGVAAVLVFLTKGSEISDMFEDLNLPDLTDEWTIWKIIETLDIPTGVKRKLGKIIQKATTLDENEQYSSAYEMREDIKVLKEVVENSGIHREVLLDGSRSMLSNLQVQKLDPELFPEALDITKVPVSKDILIPHPKSKIPLPVTQRIYPNFVDSIGIHNCMLVGEGGYGKTSRLVNEWADFLQKVETDENHLSSIPLYIELQGFDGTKAYIQDYILDKYIKETNAAREDARKKLRQLFETGEFLLLLDGVNEAINASALGSEVLALSKLSGVKVCIASRYKPEWVWLKDYRTFTLQKLDERTVRTKLQKHGFPVPSARLNETLRQPMILDKYLRLEKRTSVQSPGEILHDSIMHIEHKPEELGQELKQQLIRKFAVEAALPLLAHHIDQMVFSFTAAYSVLSQYCKEFREDLFQKIGAYMGEFVTEPILNTLLDVGVICGAENDQYRFVHENYLDLFHAEYWKEQMLHGYFPKSKLKISVMQYIGDLLREYNTTANGKSIIEKLLHEYLTEKHDDESKYAIKILVEIMKQARNKKISACFDRLDLSMVDFDGCDLQGSSFVGTIISGASFCLNYNQPVAVSFVNDNRIARQILGCPVEVLNITTGEKTVLPVPADGCYSRLDGEYYLRGDESGAIEVWSLVDGTLVATFESGSEIDIRNYISGFPCKYFVQAKYIPKHQKLVCIMPDGFIRLYDQGTGKWKELESGEGVAFDNATHFITPFPGKEYPLMNPEPENCIVVNDRIVSAPRAISKSQDDMIFVWNLEGKCIHTEIIPAKEGLRLIKLLPTSNSRYCMIVSRVSSIRKINKRLHGKLLVRFWDVEKYCYHPLMLNRAYEKEELNMFAVTDKTAIKGSYIDELNGYSCVDNGDGNYCVFEKSELKWYARATDYKEITQFCCSERGNMVALVYKNGNIVIHKDSERDPIVWNGVSASNVLNCDFSGAIVSEEFRFLLKQQGASIE